MNSSKTKQHVEDVEEFINHNLNIGYLNEEMTIKDLLQFINNIKKNYIPILEQIENGINLWFH